MNTNPPEARFTTKVGVEDSLDAADPWGSEAIDLDGGEKQMIGRATSGTHGYTNGNGYALVYANSARSQRGQKLFVKVLNKVLPATVVAESPWDPENERLRA